ncbi:MAG: hypothetical protein GY820_12790, partial [Gammaproteobacteria bacterium]|nr:hypothetical protein [Gammaproteobacteria bacterium]
MKSTLKRAIGRKLLTKSEFHTLLCEAEAIVNSRPLTYVSADINSLQVLRPVDFLIPSGSMGTPSFDYDPADPDYVPRLNSKQKLAKYWESTQQCLDKFWSLWSTEYLQSLREKFTVTHRHPRIQHPEVPKQDSIVLIQEEHLKRAAWKLGRISKLIKSADGQIRSAEVTLTNKKSLIRPINLLYPLEIDSTESSVEKTMPKDQTKVVASQSSTTMPLLSLQMSNCSLLLFVALLLFLCPLGFAKKCPLGNETQLVPIYSKNCTPAGIGIFRMKDSNLCWKMLHCSSGHLNGIGECRDYCLCPRWASHCSHYKGPAPTTRGSADAIIAMSRDNSICSYKPDPKCSDKPASMRLSQIELLNGTKLYVQTLDIQWVETTSDHYHCIGDGLLTGTPSFCANNKCRSRGTKFCYYDSAEIPFYTNAAGSLPIKAFGGIQAEIYRHRQPPESTITCFDCNIECIKGGVRISLSKEVTFVEVCTVPYCAKFSFPPEELTVMLPTEVNMMQHDVDVKIWAKGRIVKQFGTHCLSQPFCEMLNCYFCMSRIRNLHCSSTIAVIILAVSLYFISVTLYIIYTTLRIMSMICTQLCSCVRLTGTCCWKFCKRARNRTYRTTILPVFAMVQDDEENQNDDSVTDTSESNNNQPPQPRVKHLTVDSTRSYRAKLPYFLAIVAILASKNARACSEASNLMAKTSTCLINKDGAMDCDLNSVIRLNLVPQGQQTCLLIESPGGDPLGTIAVQVEHISLKCNKKSEYYTRSYQMKHQAVKRCPSMGSCYDAKCKFIQLNSAIAEFDDDVNESPGHTHCVESCGGFSCYCFLHENGCTFYRTYAEPVSDSIFEIFSCPLWEYMADVTVQLEEINTTTSTKLRLSAATPSYWNNLQITLISISSPPVPILGRQFLTNGEKIA